MVDDLDRARGNGLLDHFIKKPRPRNSVDQNGNAIPFDASPMLVSHFVWPKRPTCLIDSRYG